MVSPRGTDPRFADNERRTNVDRRKEYQERMDRKAAIRIEMQNEGNPDNWDNQKGSEAKEE